MIRPACLLLSCLAFSALASGPDWPAALRGIQAGDALALEQVPALAALADKQQAQALEDALAEALSTNTVAALKALRTVDAGKWPHMVGSDIVCTPPAEKTPAEVEAFYQRTRLALLETSDGALCLWILEAARAELEADKARQVK